MNKLQKANGLVNIISSIILVSILFLACQESLIKEVKGKTIVPQKKATQINWVGNWLYEGDKGKLLREVANEYEFLNQNIKINLKFPEDLYGMRSGPESDFITEQINKPVADWDIVRLRFTDAETVEKYFVDFNTIPGFIESHKPFLKSKLYKDQFNNHFYGPYIEGQAVALYVNTAVAKKMGIAVKQFGMTYDDFLGYIKAANDYNKSHPYIIPIFEYDWKKTSIFFSILYLSQLDNFEEASYFEITEKKLEAVYKCYQAFEELSKYNPLEKNWEKRRWAKENNFVLNDSCLFFPSFIFMYNIWKIKDQDKMDKVIPCEFPVFKPSTAYLGGFNAHWVY